MTTQRKPKTVTIPQAEYSALLGVVAAHRADAGKSPSKVLEYYDSVTRKPAPEVDTGGRVFFVTRWKMYRAIPRGSCGHCALSVGGAPCSLMSKEREACLPERNGGRGYRTLHPVQAVG